MPRGGRAGCDPDARGARRLRRLGGVHSLDGDDAREAFARLSELELPAAGSSQARSRAWRVKMLVDADRIDLLVPAMLAAHVARTHPRPTPRSAHCVTGLLRHRRVPRRSASSEAALRRRDRRRRRERPLARLPPRRVPRHPRRRRARTLVHRLGRIGPQHPGAPRQLQHARDRPPVRGEPRGCTARSRRSSTSTSCSRNQGELDLCHTPDSLQVEREKSLLNRALGVQTDILTPEEVSRSARSSTSPAGASCRSSGRRYHPPGAFARHDSVVWGYAAAAQRRGVDDPRGRRGHRHRRPRRPMRRRADRRGPDRGRPRRLGGRRAHRASSRRWRASALPIATDALQAFVTEPYRPVLRGLVSSMDLYVYVSQTARGELLVGAEIAALHHLLDAVDVRVPGRSGEAHDPDPPVHGDGARDAPVDGPVRHDARTPPRSSARAEVERFCLMAGMGTWGFKGAPIFGTTMAELIATGPDARPDRAVRRDAVPTGPDGARRRLGRHPLTIGARRARRLPWRRRSRARRRRRARRSHRARP